jgi:hypothetical protein
MTVLAKALCLALAAGAAGFCQITNLRSLGITATQAVIAYTAPSDAPCTFQVSEGNVISTLVHDVDPAIFAGSNQDNRPGSLSFGASRTVVVGKRSSELATAGPYAGMRHYSRALQLLTLHTFQVTCGTYTATTQFTTTNIPPGDTFPDPFFGDPGNPGDQPFPEALADNSGSWSFIDPLTGIWLKQVSARGHVDDVVALYPPSNPIITARNAGVLGSGCDAGGPWSTPCNAVAPNNNSLGCDWGAWATCNYGSNFTSVANSTAWLIFPLDMNQEYWGPPGYGTNYDYSLTIDQALVGMAGHTSSANNQLDVALSFNNGASAATQLQTLTLPSSNGPVSAGSVDFTAWGLSPWLLDTHPRFNREEWLRHSGTATLSGSTLTWASGDPFSTYWFQGGNGTIWLASSGDACAFTNFQPSNANAYEYALTGMLDGNNITISNPPAPGTYNWCSHNSVIMIRRHTADSTPVYIQGVSFQTVDHSPLFTVNDSSSSWFYNTPVNGGYFGYNGGLFWINTSTGDTSWFGPMQLPATTLPSGDGWGANPGQCPAQQTGGSWDQTKSIPTWYCVLTDSAGKGIVVEGQYTGPTSPPAHAASGSGNSYNTQINQYTQDATCKGTYPQYCISFGNGALVFTDLTPSSAGHSITDMLATTVPAYNPAIFNACPGPAGNAVQQGVIVTNCLSGGQDTPAWVIAVSPGDGNPAHAATAGGPHVLGAVNTFNGLMVRWRGLHAIIDLGEQPWTDWGGNDIETPITTTNTSITTTGSSLGPNQDCSVYGGTHGASCVQIQINALSGSYEPYLATPFGNVPANTPGALGTSLPQVPAPCTLTAEQTAAGDPGCYVPDTARFSNPSSGELMTLVAKNYGGVQGLQIWQRAATPASYSGSTTMYFQPSATGYQIWNPTTDPGGTGQLTDYEAAIGHGFERNGQAVQLQNIGSITCVNPLFTAYMSRLGNWPELAVAHLFYGSAVASFDGSCLVGAFPNDVQSHANAPGDLASDNEGMRAFDVRPMLANTAPAQTGVPNFSQVSGQLYKQTWPDKLDADDLCSHAGCSRTDPFSAQLNRKLVSTAASCGAHPLLDISGPQPGNPLIDGTAANSYKYCIPRVNGECYAGSQVGEIYVNCPGLLEVSGSIGCTGSGTHGGSIMGMGNDVCVWNNYSGVQMIHQLTLGVPDPSAAQQRDLSTSIGRLRMSGGMGNARLTPDNTWIVFPASYLNFNGQDIWMAKLPPWQADSVGRSSFIPTPIVVAPLPGEGITNAVVSFGYQEDGAPASLNCTTRNDPCIANAATIGATPFYFASENPNGAPCTSGCTIMVPALPQRVLYYQVLYRDAANHVVTTTSIGAIPAP